MSKTLAQILSEIATNLPDNSSGLVTPALERSTLIDITSSGRTFLNVMDYGATGNGLTDDSTAINSALSALNSAGGGTLFFPPGNYLMATSTLIPPSNSIIQGAGIDATTITNTSTAGGQDCVLTVLMTMSSGSNAGLWPSNNTTYPINAPTMGATTVTTTTAANAGNFAAGNIIMISGGLHASDFWYPSWYTTVVSVNAATGVITLAETLPFGGANITTVQQIVALPKNITVRDMTLEVNSNIGGNSGAIMEILGCESFLIENVKFVNANPTIPGASAAIGAPTRRSGFRNCHATSGAGPIELFGASESFIEGCTAVQSGLLCDGGSIDCCIINNHVKDPEENGSAFHGIYVPAYTLRIRIIGNTVIGVPSSWAGIGTVDTPDANRFQTVVGNSITGANTTNTTGIQMSKGLCVGNFISNVQNGINLESVSDTIFEGNYFDSAVTTPLATFSGTGVYRTQENPTIQTMASGVGTPTVQGSQVYNLGQSGAQNVTGFTGGLSGDEITIVMQDAHTTFVDSGSLILKGGINYNPTTAGTVMCFICTSPNNWNEKSRSQ